MAVPPPPPIESDGSTYWLYMLHKAVQEGQAAQLQILKYLLLGVGALLAVNGIPLAVGP